MVTDDFQSLSKYLQGWHPERGKDGKGVLHPGYEHKICVKCETVFIVGRGNDIRNCGRRGCR